jgi:hypothetical protein
MGSPPGPDQIEFTDRQKHGFAGLAISLRSVGAAFLVLGLVRLVAAGLEFYRVAFPLDGRPASVWSGILSVLEGLIAFVLGKILLTGGDDANFIAETKGYDKPHLLNFIGSVNFYLAVQFGLAVIVALGLGGWLLWG